MNEKKQTKNENSKYFENYKQSKSIAKHNHLLKRQNGQNVV